MTTATSTALQAFMAEHSFDRLTTSTGVIAIVLLFVVVLEREILRNAVPEGGKRNVAAFAVVAVPATVVFAVTILVRFVELSS